MPAELKSSSIDKCAVPETSIIYQVRPFNYLDHSAELNPPALGSAPIRLTLHANHWCGFQVYRRYPRPHSNRKMQLSAMRTRLFWKEIEATPKKLVGGWSQVA
jgi:hypothetical protein